MKTVFEINDKVFFLKEGSIISVNWVDFKFRYVEKGTVVNYDGSKYIVRNDKNPAEKYEIIQPIASEEEAEKLAHEMNEHLLNEVKTAIMVIEKNYL